MQWFPVGDSSNTFRINREHLTVRVRVPAPRSLDDGKRVCPLYLSFTLRDPHCSAVEAELPRRKSNQDEKRES